MNLEPTVGSAIARLGRRLAMRGERFQHSRWLSNPWFEIRRSYNTRKRPRFPRATPETHPLGRTRVLLGTCYMNIDVEKAHQCGRHSTLHGCILCDAKAKLLARQFREVWRMGRDGKPDPVEIPE